MKFYLLPLICCLLAACGGGRNFYVLSPTGEPPATQGIGIGVGPVDMANYLTEKPYVVFQSSPNKLEISDEHEWAGELPDEFARVLGSNLGRRLNTGDVRTYPWTRESGLDYQVTVNVHRFHGTAEGDAILSATWRVYRLPGSRLVASRTSTLTEPLQADGYEELVAAESRLVDRLAGEIAGQMSR